MPIEPWVKNNVHGPKTNALVIGVSRYDNLPIEPDHAKKETLGMTQVKTPAMSALKFAQWLRDSYNPPKAPLANLWLLLSPSQSEIDAADGMKEAAAAVEQPKTDVVKNVLDQWRLACTQNEEDVAVMYVAGHGAQHSSEGSVLILQDFDPNDNPLLTCAMDVGAVRRGMSVEEAAQKQFYFVDACRIVPRLFKDYWTMSPGVTLDDPIEMEARISKVYFGAASGTAALGHPELGTLFSMALIDSLNGKAVTPLAGGGWGVTTESLAKSLDTEVRRLAHKFQEKQETTPGGSGISTTLHVVADAPEVELQMRIQPEEAFDKATAELKTSAGEVIFEEAVFNPQVTRPVPAGALVVNVLVPDDEPILISKFGLEIGAVPPQTVVYVDVSNE